MFYLLIYPDDTHLTQFTANEISISLFWLNYREHWSSQVKFSETMKWNFNRYFFIRWNLMNKFVMNFMKIKCFCTKYICSVFVIDIFGFNDSEKSRSPTIYSERVTLKRYLKFWISVQLSVRLKKVKIVSLSWKRHFRNTSNMLNNYWKQLYQIYPQNKEAYIFLFQKYMFIRVRSFIDFLWKYIN